MLAQGLTAELGQTVLVENKGGASGIIGSEMVVKSPADGYTLLFAPSSHATLGALYPDLSVRPDAGLHADRHRGAHALHARRPSQLG